MKTKAVVGCALCAILVAGCGRKATDEDRPVSTTSDRPAIDAAKSDVPTDDDPEAGQPGEVKLLAVLKEGAKPVEAAMGWSILEPEADLEGKRKQVAWEHAQSPVFTLPQGRYVASVTYGHTVAETEIKVEAGRQEVVVVNLNAGRVKLEAVLKEGGKPVEAAMGWSIFHPEVDLEGKRKQAAWEFAAAPVFTLPEGRYLVSVQYGDAVAETEIEVQAGQQEALLVDLNAGRVKLTATLEEGGQPVQEAMEWSILQAEADPEGNRKKVARQYAASPIFTLPAGQYLVTVTGQDKTASKDLLVEAGTSAELVVVLE